MITRVGTSPRVVALGDIDVVPFDKLGRVESFNGIRRYRFAYIASFTNSFVQVLDLDNFERSATFERVVYTLGRPTTPKGS